MITRLFTGGYQMAFTVKRLLVFLCAVAGAIAINFELATAISAAPIEAQAIAEHFSSVKSMTGDFVQVGPKGDRQVFSSTPGQDPIQLCRQIGGQRNFGWQIVGRL
jgi:ABC-type microcin C transport system permease subunit YejB